MFAVARRAERLETLAAETGAVALPADVADDADVARLLDEVTRAGGIDTLINIAGGARSADKVAEAKTEDWEWMYQVNVLGSMKLIRAFLPMLRACGEGTVLNLTSTAGLTAYEGGGGYNAAKFAQHALTGALRLEEAEHNVRVIEVAPGMVYTEEFALNRLGDQDAAAKVYAGVAKPLTAEDVADVVRYAVAAPHHVNLDEIVIRPVAQGLQLQGDPRRLAGSSRCPRPRGRGPLTLHRNAEGRQNGRVIGSWHRMDRVSAATDLRVCVDVVDHDSGQGQSVHRPGGDQPRSGSNADVHGWPSAGSGQELAELRVIIGGVEVTDQDHVPGACRHLAERCEILPPPHNSGIHRRFRMHDCHLDGGTGQRNRPQNPPRNEGPAGLSASGTAESGTAPVSLRGCRE